jgi:hypothetical protein
MIGHGKKAQTPELLAGFAAFLDLSPRDLSTLTGIDLTDASLPVHPHATEAAAPHLEWPPPDRQSNATS